MSNTLFQQTVKPHIPLIRFRGGNLTKGKTSLSTNFLQIMFQKNFKMTLVLVRMKSLSMCLLYMFDYHVHNVFKAANSTVLASSNQSTTETSPPTPKVTNIAAPGATLESHQLPRKYARIPLSIEEMEYIQVSSNFENIGKTSESVSISMF